MAIAHDRKGEEMNKIGIPPRGQSLVETTLVLPLLLILLGGGYWFYRDLSLSSSAESAAHTQMLRAGRRLSGIEPRLSRSIHPTDNVARVDAHNDPLIGKVPLFRSLSGRTTASANVSLGKEPVGAFLSLPSHALRKDASAAVDCWETTSRSGSTVRRTVQGILVTGVVR
jgi:hypothetical protein